MLKYITGPITKADAGGLAAVITTPRVDSDGESVDPLGLMNRDEYMANPLVYWAHEWVRDRAAEPIGQATMLDVHRDRIDSAAIYAPTPKAQNIRALVLGKFVRKTSIGFDPLVMAHVNGIPTHTRWALLEWSIVPMPSNTDATVTGVKSALRWLADTMPDEMTEDGPNVATVTNLDAEALLATLDDAHLALGNDAGAVTVSDRGRIIIRMRPKPVARFAPPRIVLPDSAYAAIDSKGRHYPHHTPDGALDLDALRSALAATSEGDLGRRHLEAHARSAGIDL